VRLVFALLAESAVVNRDDGKFSMLAGGFDVIEAASFPHTQQQLALVFQIELEASEVDKRHDLSVRTLDPEGQLLVDEALTSVNPVPPRKDGLPVGVTLVLTMHSTQFPTPGDYRFVITWDSIDVGLVRLRLLNKDTTSPRRISPLLSTPAPRPRRPHR
jgi:hypothetical protein